MVDEEVVVTGLERINQYTNELKEMRGLDREEYLNDIVLQRAVERTLMNLIQSCIDLASHIRASEELDAARTSKEEIESLGDADIITAETQAKLEEASASGTCLSTSMVNSITISCTTCCTTTSTGSNGSSTKLPSGCGNNARSGHVASCILPSTQIDTRGSTFVCRRITRPKAVRSRSLQRARVIARARLRDPASSWDRRSSRRVPGARRPDRDQAGRRAPRGAARAARGIRVGPSRRTAVTTTAPSERSSSRTLMPLMPY